MCVDKQASQASGGAVMRRRTLLSAVTIGGKGDERKKQREWMQDSRTVP
jgi:hypothetical protein